MKTDAANVPNGTPTIGAVMLINQLGLIGISLKNVIYHSMSDLWASMALPDDLMRSEQQTMSRRLANVFERR